jgi:prepilin-type N-terminal cleavage/methylation domain-containing protein
MSKPTRRPSARAAARRLGFTLIELLAVIAIIGILMVFLLPEIPAAIGRARVTACRKNLSEIYNGLTAYEMQYENLPVDGGARFFTCLIYRGTWENTKANVKKMSCPGVKPAALGLAGEPTEWYANKEDIHGGMTAYAGRDVKNHPLRRLQDGLEPLVCDDNDGGMNHRTSTNVLYGNGAVEVFELYLLREDGTIPADETEVRVGPDSDVEDLRKFSLD